MGSTLSAVQSLRVVDRSLYCLSCPLSGFPSMQLYMHNMGEVEVEVQQPRKVARVEPRPLGGVPHVMQYLACARLLVPHLGQAIDDVQGPPASQKSMV